MNQKEINFKEIIKAADVVCRFCAEVNSIKCKSCGVNLTIQKNYDKLSLEEREMVECPWNGIENPLDTRKFEFGE